MLLLKHIMLLNFVYKIWIILKLYAMYFNENNYHDILYKDLLNHTD